MQTNAEGLKNRLVELLESGAVTRVLGWAKGEFEEDLTPAVFTSKEELEKDFVFGPYCGANLSKYLIKASKGEGKIAVLLKPCDNYSFVQLQKEHRIVRENVYAIGIPCDGMLDATGDKLLKCKTCKSLSEEAFAFIDCDEVMEAAPATCTKADTDRFDEVAKLEAMTPDERYAFWQNELSRCIRCNACRNVCPACSCEKCVFENPNLARNKAIADSFEENLFHVIRAFHVAGRCTDCGECSRVCPEHIPLHLLNRKFMKDINELYGNYQAGADLETKAPLTNFTKEDVEPSVVYTRGGDEK